MRFKSFHQDIGRNLEENIWYEEDREGDIRLVACEAQVVRQTKCESVGDIHAVKESSKVYIMIWTSV